MSMVEWKKLEEICTVLTGGDAPSNCVKGQAKPSLDNPYPIYSNGDDVYGYCSSYRVYKDAVTISSIGNVGSVNYRLAFFTPIIRLKVVIPSTPNLITKFLYYTLLGYKFVGTNSSLSSMKAADIKRLQIPIPSLQEQQRIVGILDTFTSSIENLKEQIVQRRKQYEYYRDQLLDLEGKEGVEMKRLGEIFTFKNGLNKGKEYFGVGKPIIMFTNVFNSRFIDASMIKSKVNISEEELERINARIGDVFFTRTSETRDDVGYASVLIEEIKDCTFAGFLIRARPITNALIPSFCKYCFSTPSVRAAIVSNCSFTTRASLTGGGLSGVTIPTPPLQEQSRIVSILDTFEASIRNLEEQLAQRQKQYEYYRNKLLTFE